MRNGTVYEACPHCLTEIAVEKPVIISAAGPKIPEKSEIEEKLLAKEEFDIQTVPEKNECKHYFGYLSKRSSKEGLPEECIMCEKIVQCMLKTITE